MHRFKIISTFALLLMSIIFMTSCNLVAPVAFAIHGPEKINPQYTLPENAKTVVFVDDPSSKIAQRRLRYAMAETTTQQLLGKRVLTNMLESRGIIAAAAKETHSERMSISELGQSVGADIVIYAVVTSFSLSPETGSYIPQATLRVKVIDVAEGKRVWPQSDFGQQMQVQIPQLPGDSPQDAANRLAMEQELARRAGLGLSQLFYRHEIGESVLNRR